MLSDKKGGEIFTLFSLWHYFYIALTVLAITVILIALKNKTQYTKTKTAKILVSIAFALYIADFFLMPLAYGSINAEKLPFHVCTTMCVMCFLSYRIRFLEKFRISFALLGFLCNFVYLICPAGVMWHEVHPLSYRVIQTLLFHSIMAVYGFTVLVSEYQRLSIKKCHLDLAVLVCMTVWALIGNYIYNSSAQFFNWFFVVEDPFSIFPKDVSPFIMPFLNIAMFFAAEILIHLVFFYVRSKKNKK